jgi:hypothetical protein
MQTWAMRLFLGFSLAVIPAAASADDVDTILKRWSEHVARHPLKGLHGTARLYVYDDVFQTDSRGKVEFWISGPEEWRVDVAPAEIGREQGSARGKAITLRPLQRYDRWSQSTTELTQAVGGAHGLPDVFRCDVPQLLRDRRRGEEEPQPGLFRAIAQIPSEISETLPGVIQLGCSGPSGDPDSFYFRHPENWMITLAAGHGDPGRIHLELRPQSASLKRSISSVEVLLTGSDFTPIGVRVCDAAHTMSTIYAFEGIRDLPYNDDPFGLNALASWPPQCRARSDDPPPPSVATRLAD